MENRLYYSYFETKLSRLLLMKTQVGLARVDSLSLEDVRQTSWFNRYFKGAELVKSDLAFDRDRQQLQEYFAGDRSKFDLDLDGQGTPFQKEVWQALQSIPYGQTLTYGGLADRLGRSSKAAQAVGRALGQNPLLVVVPCHRILSQDGKLTGYRGGLALKKALLKVEGINYI
ncbi:Methylated-DNA--protein-cysteine methyltransferase, constitutive [Alloiococcus otitis]|uniref:Methylated-DNA--protein-cysteine methyltransferase n=1 Tax=Alloiococcus otitis ATCC 51267 TaxID=883081 RepID=K9E9D4_9LACT|nr:methylated-DNA--[protein]-cysteine S-methyltransferase [Alloiococcus otitis]EKU93824.1 methylated-DNA-[protein]-cysteine S-methyltransferase [Alloiococcus otitis ATCC 51267]SUU81795.1 Methylated-DNA--protein-cysteine methyltransferase, constitutive [Alloiococcus otitis]